MISWTESLVKNFEGMSGPVPGSRPRGRPRKDGAAAAAAASGSRSVIVAPGLVPFPTSTSLTQQQQQQVQHEQQNQQSIFRIGEPLQNEDDEPDEEVDEDVHHPHHHHHHSHPHPHHHHQQQHQQPQQQQQQPQSQQHQQQQQSQSQSQQQQSQQSQGMDGAEDDEMLVRKKKEIKRSWREEWKLQHKWVYPVTKETGELRLKCQWCTTYNMDNVFAKEGCSTIQLSALNTHAKSEAHKTAESRWESSDAAITSLTVVPDNLWGFGAKAGAVEGDAGEGLDGPELNGSSAGAAADLNRKRKAAQHPSSSSAAAAAAARGGVGGGGAAAAASLGENLSNILQKNNNRIVEVLLEAETGRNRRHAVDVGLAKKQYALEDQRQRLDSERLQFERARLEAVVQLGQQYNAALANIGNGLLKIGAALEQAKKTS